jgi:hypothetical protein
MVPVCGCHTSLSKAVVKMTPTKRFVMAKEGVTKKRLAKVLKAWAPKVAKQIMSMIPADKMAKGDFDGHPFRGNQYTDGEGGGEKEAKPISQSKAEDKFMFGGCASFAIALQEKIGGDLHALTRGGKQLHVYVNKDGQAYDVTGKTSPVRMALKLVGSATGVSTEKITKDKITTKAPNDKDVKIASTFIGANKGKFGKVDLGLLYKADDEDIKKLVDKILADIDLDGYSIQVIEALRDDILQAFKQGGLSGLDLIGMQNDRSIVKLVNDKAVDFARDRAAALVGMSWDSDSKTFVPNPNADMSITETTRESLRAIVTQALEDGSSTDDLSSLIRESYGFSDARAEMIARTELAFAHTQGNMDAWNDSGVVDGKESILADTHPIEDECNENADAGVIPLNETFPSGDMAPPYHPNCLCSLSPVLSKEVEENSQTQDSN